MTMPAWTFYGVIVAGAAGILCLLPRGAGRRRGLSAAGTLLAVAALAGLIVWLLARRQVAALMPLGQPVVGPFFYLFAAIALASAVRVVVHPRPIYSVVYFVMTVLAVGGCILLAGAEFLAVALIIIYAGAILVVYVFVIMLARQAGGPDESPADHDVRTRAPVGPLLAGLLLLAALGGPLADRDNWPASPMRMPAAARLAPPGAVPTTRPQRGGMPSLVAAPPRAEAAAPSAGEGSIGAIGVELFENNLVAVELAGVLLLVAIVGAVAVARRRTTPAPRSDSEGER